MATDLVTTPRYSELPERIVPALASYRPDTARTEEQLARFRDVVPRDPDVDGASEHLDGVTFTHRFVDVDGRDGEIVRFHYVEAGTASGEPVVFLHGLPDSWYQWHHQMAAFAGDYRCVAFDLKGYGQSSTAEGDYRHEAAAEQLVAALDRIGVDRFNLVTHDRGSVQGDFIAAGHPDRVLRYGRGEQHLYHFHPALAPQAAAFRDSPFTGLMADRTRFVVLVYTWIGHIDLPDDEMRRVIQEFSYPDIDKSVPRYFNTATFRTEWIARRTRLLERWTCPVMVIQSHEGTVQPREYYVDARDYIPNAADVLVRFVDAGHFWTLEDPETTTAHLRELLALPIPGTSAG
ncbi:alpha/beta fold hydrolase [Mycobacterium sp.]|uniref:alpha/beta fold hydrolase n=1 Tax=Mycobacterium sp. TaxID=1785 RepID=UPI000CBC0B49|nr:alpha/beta fold hydrolase [Mycobacterium sp.]PJE14077.1 MAG: alpha/beta hydrolase [Mycobacterium sp.]